MRQEERRRERRKEDIAKFMGRELSKARFALDVAHMRACDMERLLTHDDPASAEAWKEAGFELYRMQAWVTGMLTLLVYKWPKRRPPREIFAGIMAAPDADKSS
jgi:hypothetical protein